MSREKILRYKDLYEKNIRSSSVEDREMFFREIRNLKILERELPPNLQNVVPRLAVLFPIFSRSQQAFLKGENSTEKLGFEVEYHDWIEDPNSYLESPNSFTTEREYGMPSLYFLRQADITNIVYTVFYIGNTLAQIYDRTEFVYGDFNPLNFLVKLHGDIPASVFIVDWESACKEGENIPQRFWRPYSHPIWRGAAIKREFDIAASVSQDIHALTLLLASFVFPEVQASLALPRELLEVDTSSFFAYENILRDYLRYKFVHVLQGRDSSEEAHTLQDKHKMKPLISFFHKYAFQPYDAEVYNWNVWLNDLKSIVNEL